MFRSPLLGAILYLAAATVLPVSKTFAQTNGNQGGGAQAAGGIQIDADGVVQSVVTKARPEKLDKVRMEAFARDTLNADVNKPSPMRKVSLVGLERAYEPFAGKEGSVPPEIFHLAGLQRIDYVFIDSEQRDIVIAGRAEGFAPNSVGRVVGTSTGRATLRLDDLVVALQASKRREQVGCSIDAAPERLQALRQYVVNNSSPTSAARAGARYGEMARVLGMQTVKVWGIPTDSHFSYAFVEADYRMKCIALGIENPGVRGLQSHLGMLMPQGNTMQRWWMAPYYEPIVTTPERDAYKISGQRVQLMSQEEVTDAAGNRRDAAFTRLSTQQYAQHFTEKFPQLAAASPVFSEVQNLFDLLIVAALISKEGLNERVGWPMSVFLDESRTAFPKSRIPKQVASLANFRRATNGFVVGLISGGVVIRAQSTLDQIEFRPDTEQSLIRMQKQSIAVPRPADGRWWWD